MKHLKRNILIVLTGLICLAAVGCGGSGSGTSIAPISVACPGMNLVEVFNNITANTIWRTNTVYIIRAWDFYVNATLTIEPGVIIKFHPTLGPGMALGGAGTIVAQGTAANPIIFTSFKDDASGCDNNGDGAATTPARRDWASVDTNGLNGSIFDYCNFYYGGASAYSSTLALSAGSIATVTNSIFAHNDGSDASGWYGALDASNASAGTVITDNTFFDNVRPLSVSTAYDIDDSNTFHNPDNPAQMNTYNGIFVESINEITSPIMWGETEVAFVIDDNDFYINSGATLTLGDDVVLKFRPGSVLLLDDGESALVNHGGPGVAFTSYKDDTRKGDTNGDGGATTAGSADWLGIYNNLISVSAYVTWTNIYHAQYH